MGPRRRRIRLVVTVLLAISVAASLTAGDAAAKKKKKHKATVFSASVIANTPIPDEPALPDRDIPVVSTVTVGKKFKGKTVGDVNVTGIQTTGDQATSAGDLSMSLSAPSGRLVVLEATSLGGQSIGPLTFDDDTPTSICNSATLTCADPDSTLIRPFAGTANLLGLSQGDLAPLSVLNGVGMRGTWTFRIWDNSSNSRTSTLNSWGVQITPERPVK
jgi:hypothetical protein